MTDIRPPESMRRPFSRKSGLGAVIGCAQMLRAASLALALSVLLIAGIGPTSSAESSPQKGNRGGGLATMPGNEEILSWIEDLTALGARLPGTKAGSASARYLVEQLKGFGLSHVGVQRATSFRWQAKRWGLTVGGQPIDSFPVAHSFVGPRGNGRFSTGKDGLTAPLVDVGDGTVADFAANDVQGKIVVFNLQFLVPRRLFLLISEWYYDPNNTTREEDYATANPYLTNYDDVVEQAIDGGAVGFIGVLADYWNSNKYIPEYTGEVPIPGLWVTPVDGALIRSSIAGQGGASSANLQLEGKRVRATARNVIGYLPGISTDTVMIQSHHDSVWDGGVEDASGTAEVLALAKYFGQIPSSDRQKTLMFALMDSHYTGYQAHRKFVRTYIENPRAKRRIVANVTIEHIGKQAEVGPNGELLLLDMPEYRGVFQNTSDPIKQTIMDAIVNNDLERTAMFPTVDLAPLIGGLPTDASFVFDAGVPTISFISGPIYLYDEADTIETVYVEDLQPVAKAFAEIVNELLSTPSADIPSDATPTP